MLHIQHVSFLKITPLKVWSALTDLEGYQHWNPRIRLSGKASLGAVVDYSIDTNRFGKTLAATATIITYDKPVEFAWRTGLNGILLFEDSYKIAVDPAGTRLLHELRFSGVFAWLWYGLMKRRLIKGLIAEDMALERQMRRQTIEPTSTRTQRRADKRATSGRKGR
jgi:hypothetical protein